MKRSLSAENENYLCYEKITVLKAMEWSLKPILGLSTYLLCKNLTTTFSQLF